MNEHTQSQSGIYDLAQTPSGELITFDTRQRVIYNHLRGSSMMYVRKGKPPLTSPNL